MSRLLTYEESLWLFQKRWDGKLPSAPLKVYLRFLLRGLDYLHSECHIIHTGRYLTRYIIEIIIYYIIDLKLDNILSGFEDRSVLEDFVHKHDIAQIHRKTKVVN